MIVARLLAMVAALALAGCVSAPPGAGGASPARPAPLPPVVRPGPVAQPSIANTLPPPVQGTAIAGFIAPEIMQADGLEGVIRAPAPALLRLFGAPRLETFEGDMRKLQFESPACVLDVFLYPLAPGAQPVATWVEARRRSDGAAVDRAACVAALSAR